MVKSLGIAFGHKKGYPVKGIKKDPKRNNFTPGKRHKFVSNLVDEVMGYSPYEGRLMELMSSVMNTHSQEKRPLKFAKKRLGKIKRAKRKLRKVESLKQAVEKRLKEIEKRKAGKEEVKAE